MAASTLADRPKPNVRGGRCQHGAIHVSFPDSNFLIAGRTRFPHEKYFSRDGAFSLKVVHDGAERYDFNGSRYEVRAGRALLVPQGATFRAEPEPNAAVCPLFFSSQSVAEVQACVAGGHEEDLLEGATQRRDYSISLLNFDPRLNRAVQRMERLLLKADSMCNRRTYRFDQAFSIAIETSLQNVLAQTIRSFSGLQTQLQRMSAVKSSTRGELHRRLSFAEDRMRSDFAQPLTLSELARTAHMSTYHFAERFSEFYGQSPHRFLMNLRLAHARQLIASTDTPLKEVAVACGYQSLPSFVALCTREWGRSPATLRKF